jgi:hypothetical protein
MIKRKDTITARVVKLLPYHRNCEIVKKLQCSSSLVHQQRKALNIPAPPRVRVITRKQEQLAKKIRKVADDCVSIRDVGRRVGRSFECVKSIAELFGIPMPRWAERRLKVAYDRELKKAVEKTGSYTRAAALLKVSYATVFRQALKLKIKSPYRQRGRKR